MDEWGNPSRPEKVFVANDLEVDFQPSQGKEGRHPSGTEYESQPQAFHTWPDLLEGSIQEGMKVAVRRDGVDIGQFVVVFVSDHIHHWRLRWLGMLEGRRKFLRGLTDWLLTVKEGQGKRYKSSCQDAGVRKE